MTDLLLDLYAQKQIAVAELRAGREWQRWVERACIQPFRSMDWSRSIGLQALFQPWGGLSEKQLEAVDARRECRKHIGAEAATLLDILLLPEATRRSLYLTFGRGIDAAILWLPAALKTVAMVWDIQAEGRDDGYFPTPIEERLTSRELRHRRLAMTQPNLLVHARRQPGPLRAQRIET